MKYSRIFPLNFHPFVFLVIEVFFLLLLFEAEYSNNGGVIINQKMMIKFHDDVWYDDKFE